MKILRKNWPGQVTFSQITLPLIDTAGIIAFEGHLEMMVLLRSLHSLNLKKFCKYSLTIWRWWYSQRLRFIHQNIHCSVDWKTVVSSWFQTFAALWMWYSFFWAIARRLNFLCRRFGTLCSIFIGRLNKELNSYLNDLWRWNRVFRNIGTETSDAEESPKRKNTTLFIDVIFCLCMPVTTLDLLLCSWTNQPDIPTLPFCVHGQISPIYQHRPFVFMDKSTRHTSTALLRPWTNSPTNQHRAFVSMDKSSRQTNTALLCPWTNHPDIPALPFCAHWQISPTNQHCPFVSMDKSSRQTNTTLLYPWTNKPDKTTLPFCFHGQISPTSQHCPFRNNCIIVLLEVFFLQPLSCHAAIFSVSFSSISIFHAVLKVVRNGLECRPLFIPATPADYLSFTLVASLRHLRYMTCKLWLKKEAFHYHAARVKSAIKHAAFSHYVTICYFRTVNQGKTSVNEDFSNLQENTTFNLHDFRRPPRCKWDLRFLVGRMILRGLDWYFLTDVAGTGQPIGPFLQGSSTKTFEDGTDRLSRSRNVGKKLPFCAVWKLQRAQTSNFNLFLFVISVSEMNSFVKIIFV